MTTPCNKRVKIDATEHEVPSEVTVHPEMAWNDEMHAFYNFAYGLDAEVDDVNEKPAQYSDTDHQSPKERTKCAMCGAGDHSPTTCPSSCCLKCGEKTDSFQDECAQCVGWASKVCTICGEQGHSKNDCPDHWRCYHSTIDDTVPVEYSMIEDPRNFTFKWDSSGNPALGQFYQRFLTGNKQPANDDVQNVDL